MASLNTEVLLFLLLATLYFQFTVSAEVMLRKNCSNTNQCSDGNAFCFSDCKCKNAVYKDNTSSCSSQIVLGGVCNFQIPCQNRIAMCPGTCLCLDPFYKDNNGTCISKILPNKSCAITNEKDDPCVQDAHCKSGFCECDAFFRTTKTRCNPKSAATMAVVDVSAVTLCFVLAFFDVSKYFQ